MNLKVGVMPGRLQEVVVESGATAREIFEIAEIVVSNHEVRLDGNVINLDDCVHNGKLLVAMKQIKGNVRTIKVGVMPGKLQEIEVNEDDTASELFEKAGITIDRHEIRLDGSVIDLDTEIENGKLLVAMKQIKGNADVYITSLDEDETMYLLNEKLPNMIKVEDIDFVGDGTVMIFEKYIVDEEMFKSVYEKGYDTGSTFITEKTQQEEQHECKCKNAVDIIERKIEELKSEIELHEEAISRKRTEIYVLQDVLKEMK